MSNSSGPDQDRCFVGPDLGPNCLQRLTTEGSRLIYNNEYKQAMERQYQLKYQIEM